MNEKKLVDRNLAVVLGLLCIVLLISTVGSLVYYNSTSNENTSIHSHTDSEYTALTSQLAAANTNITSLNLQLSTLQEQLARNNSQTADLNIQISNLNTQIKNADENVKKLEDYYNSLMYVLNTDNHDLSVQFTTANSQISSLQNQVNTLNAIANLSAFTIWVNNQTINQIAGNTMTWIENASYAGYVTIRVSSPTINSVYANVTYTAYGVNYNVQTSFGSNNVASFPILPSSNIALAVGNSLQSGIATENVTITYYY